MPKMIYNLIILDVVKVFFVKSDSLLSTLPLPDLP